MSFSWRKIDVVHVFVALLWIGLTAGSVFLNLKVEPGSPALLEVDQNTLFLRGTWEIWLAWALATATLALAAQVRRRPKLAALGLVPLAALCLWLAHPSLVDTDPEAREFRTADQLGGEERRTVLIGMDALSWNRLLPLVQAGRLPHFAQLMEEGSYGVLESLPTFRPSTRQTGFWSPVVWTTIATGVTEDRHGIDDFTVKSGDGDGRMAMSWHRKAPAFWDVFSAFHRPVGVVGWWASFPAEEVSGIMVSSSVGLRGHRGLKNVGIEDPEWFRRRKNLTHPEWYKHVVAEDVGLPRNMADWFDEEIFPFREVPVLDPENLDTLVSVAWQDRLYLDTLLHLLETERDTALYSAYFEGVDVLNHRFWQYLDSPERLAEQAATQGVGIPDGFDAHRRVVDRYYEVMDDYLGRVMEAAGEDATLMVVSDHGFVNDPDHPRGADHSPWGAILMRGPGIRAGHDLNLSLPESLAHLAAPVDILDVLPTLLYLHGLPVSDELQGEVISGAFTRSFIGDHPLLTVPTYGDFESSREIAIETADEEEYLERMKSLGYIN